jgi:hypothetical protein
VSQPGVSVFLPEEQAMASPHLAASIVPLGWEGVSGAAGPPGGDGCARMRSGRTARRRALGSAGQNRSEPVSRPVNRLALSCGREGVFTAPLDFAVIVTVAESGWVTARLSDGKDLVRRAPAIVRR